jgi:hypothetical protein
MRKYNLIVLLSFFSIALLAQDKYHELFWSRASVQTSFHKTEFELELELRLQDYNTRNPFSYPLSKNARVWLKRKVGRSILLGFSPLAFHNQHGLAITNENYKQRLHELRMLFFTERHTSTQSIEFATRGAVEAICAAENHPSSVLRLRLKSGLKYHFKKHLYLTLAEEVFYKPMPLSNASNLNQNRANAGALISYKPFSVEFGYMNQLIFSSMPHVNNNIFYLNFNLNLKQIHHHG